MALAKGTNCGFVTTAPTADPASTDSNADTNAWGFKDTTPVGVYIVTEIGWYCDNATEAADFDVGIYTHDAGNDRPDALVLAASTAAKGTTSGWKKVSGLHIPVTSSTIYWIAFQLDDTETNTMFNAIATGGEKLDYKSPVTELPSTWGVSDDTLARLGAVYALIVKTRAAFLLNMMR